jgi:hypothetical protein
MGSLTTSEVSDESCNNGGRQTTGVEVRAGIFSGGTHIIMLLAVRDDPGWSFTLPRAEGSSPKARYIE